MLKLELENSTRFYRHRYFARHPRTRTQVLSDHPRIEIVSTDVVSVGAFEYALAQGATLTVVPDTELGALMALADATNEEGEAA